MQGYSRERLRCDSGSVNATTPEVPFVIAMSRLDAAATTFELAAGFLPESSLVFGGLGRVHLLHGDTLSAISAYERACDLSPHNRGAETMLRRLRGR